MDKMLVFLFFVLFINKCSGKNELSFLEDDSVRSCAKIEGRTFLALTFLSWIIYLAKSILRPMRSIYLKIEPEIFMTSCIIRPYIQRRFYSQIGDINHAQNDYFGIKSIYRTFGEIMKNASEIEGVDCFIKYIKIRFFKWLDD